MVIGGILGLHLDGLSEIVDSFGCISARKRFLRRRAQLSGGEDLLGG
jgi:hypothetical protein